MEESEEVEGDYIRLRCFERQKRGKIVFQREKKREIFYQSCKVHFIAFQANENELRAALQTHVHVILSRGH